MIFINKIDIMNQEYGLKNEEKDYILLKNFNKDILKLNELGRTPEHHHTDASGLTRDGQHINIELKYRNININTYSTMFLESHKAADMLLDYVTLDYVPLYINFLQDGHVIVFNLAKLKHRPETVCKYIKSKLYDGFELAKRQMLNMGDAYIYKLKNNEYKLISKPE